VERFEKCEVYSENEHILVEAKEDIVPKEICTIKKKLITLHWGNRKDALRPSQESARRH
jgi:hypothetical protein